MTFPAIYQTHALDSTIPGNLKRVWIVICTGSGHELRFFSSQKAIFYIRRSIL